MRPVNAPSPGRRRAARLSLLCVCVILLAAIWSACGGDSDTGLDERLIEQGKAVYERDCQVCHGDARTGAGATDNSPPHGRTGHTWHHPDGHLKAMILGTMEYEGKTMPPFEGKLTDEELDAVLEYIKAGWDGEQRAWQAEASRQWMEAQGGGAH